MKTNTSISTRLPSSSRNPNPKSQPKDPGLKRSDSLPGRLPSHPPERAEVESARMPITRAKPDTRPPIFYSPPPGKPRGFLERINPFNKKGAGRHPNSEERIRIGAARKAHAMEDVTDGTGYRPDFMGDSEYLSMVKAYHPKFSRYSLDEKLKALDTVLGNHPRYEAGMAESRNAKHGIPNGPTATRKMKPGEQRFLTNAFRQLQEDYKKNPFHIHGETALVGNRKGDIVQTNYNPANSVSFTHKEGDKYNVHTHPPFSEPFGSSASAPDHFVAAQVYLERDKMGSYVTNGKDVLHIMPNSTELVKLIPDPKVEKKLGKFPEAFTLPTPEKPPRPFSNHEAPAGFKKWDPKK